MPHNFPNDKARQMMRQIMKLWAPPEELSVSAWADKNFWLSPEYAAEHGKWTTHSFQREPLDTVSNPLVWQTVIKSCTQLLKTTVIQIGTAYVIDKDPGPILIVQPREDDARSFSKERLAPMFRDVPCIREKVSDSKARKSDNTIEEKWFRGGLLAITSAGSPGNLARRAIRFLFCDEEDKWVASAGVEGKPFSLALKRTATFRHRKKAIRCCSPTVAGSAIDSAYEDSDRREYYVTCPFCKHAQSMMLKFRTQVRWDSTLETREEQARSARYYCESCDEAWDDGIRIKAVENGEWRAHAPFHGIAGFWISELYSPWKLLYEIVLDYLTKKGNPEDLKTFVNTSLAENWKEPGEVLEWRSLSDRREPYPVATVPAGGLVLTAGVDVQRADGGRLEVEILALGENRETWSVDYRILYGNPAQREVWEKLETVLQETFPHELGGELTIERLFVDSGDGSVTREVYQWVATQPRPRVWAIKGDRRGDLPVGPPKSIENLGGKKTRFGTLLRLINVDYFKAGLFADLKKNRPSEEELQKGMTHPQGYCHFPLDMAYNDEHFKQLCSEELVSKRDRQGRTKTEYQQKRPRNEALDTRIYAMAAAWDLGIHKYLPQHWETLRERVRRARPEAAPQGAPKRPPNAPFRPVAGRIRL